MRVVVDTNVLLGATFEELPSHAPSVSFLRALLRSGDRLCLTWVNVYEYLRVATHARVFSRPLRWNDAKDQMAALLRHTRTDLLSETPDHLRVLSAVVEGAGGASGNFVHDCHIATLMSEHDVRTIITADAGFRRFRGLEVLAPEEAEGRLWPS